MKYDVRKHTTGETFVPDSDEELRDLLRKHLEEHPEDDGYLDARFTIIELPKQRIGAGKQRSASSFL